MYSSVLRIESVIIGAYIGVDISIYMMHVIAYVHICMCYLLCYLSQTPTNTCPESQHVGTGLGWQKLASR